MPIYVLTQFRKYDFTDIGEEYLPYLPLPLTSSGIYAQTPEPPDSRDILTKLI